MSFLRDELVQKESKLFLFGVNLLSALLLDFHLWKVSILVNNQKPLFQNMVSHVLVLLRMNHLLHLLEFGRNIPPALNLSLLLASTLQELLPNFLFIKPDKSETPWKLEFVPHEIGTGLPLPEADAAEESKYVAAGELVVS